MKKQRALVGAGLVSLAGLVLTACQPGGPDSAPAPEADQAPDRVAEAIAKARNAGDYRLWITGGRRQVMPGVDQAIFDEARKLCGIKVLDGSGDVMGDQAQRQRRREAIDFASDYNARMLAHCRDHHGSH